MYAQENPYTLFAGAIPLGAGGRYKIPALEDSKRVLDTILARQLPFLQSGDRIFLSADQTEDLTKAANEPFCIGRDDTRVHRRFSGAASAVINYGREDTHESLDKLKEDYQRYHVYLRSLANVSGVDFDKLTRRDGQLAISSSRSQETASFLAYSQDCLSTTAVMSLSHLVALVLCSPKHLKLVAAAINANSRVRSLVSIALEDAADLLASRDGTVNRPAIPFLQP